jgi:DNA adenine methylase
MERSGRLHQSTGKIDFFDGQLSPFVKWPGGKTSELGKISDASPVLIAGRFLDPFVGGGSVLLALSSDIPALANDICPELISLFQGGAENNEQLIAELMKISDAWDSLNFAEGEYPAAAVQLMENRIDSKKISSHFLTLTSDHLKEFSSDFFNEFSRRLTKDLPSKIMRMSKLQIERKRLLPLKEYSANIEGSVRAAFYMAIRNRYNQARLGELYDDTRTADFMFIREFCYASMFRFNSAGEFNIPYGGISYNGKRFKTKISKLFDPAMQNRLRNTSFSNLDFEPFLTSSNLNSEDFLFIDPPYDSDFTDYDGREFRSNDQVRLSKYLRSTPAKVMVVIGDTPLIRNLYEPAYWNLQEDDLNYKWTIKSRNNRAKKHLTITNY